MTHLPGTESSITLEQRQELTEFLQVSSIFKCLDARIIEGISPLFESITCGPGHVVFAEGEEADSLYIVRRGAVEVFTGGENRDVLAYLTAGECFGEMGIVHGTTRNATVRVPESAVVLRLERAHVEELRVNCPEITTAFAEIINKRLSGTAVFRPPGLQGNLTFFDLPTVVQTVLNSRKCGKLSLLSRSGKVVGEVSVNAGAVTAARFQHLHGEPAFYELMCSPIPAEFAFIDREPSSLYDDSELSKRAAPAHLLELARRLDELPKLEGRTGWPRAIYFPCGKALAGQDFASVNNECASHIFSAIGEGKSAKDLYEKLNYDRYTLLSCLEEMLRKGLVRKEFSLPVEDDDTRKTAQLPKPEINQQINIENAASDAALLNQQKNATAEILLQARMSELLNLINSFNAISMHFGQILSEAEVRMLLHEALALASGEFACLNNIGVQTAAPILDLKAVAGNFSQSEQTINALRYLTKIFVDLLSRHNWYKTKK